MKVYLLNIWEYYYPDEDNTYKVFLTREKALEFIQSIYLEESTEFIYEGGPHHGEIGTLEFKGIVTPEGDKVPISRYEIFEKEVSE